MDIIFDAQMSPGDMHALDEFAKLHRPGLAVEVGSWKGLSTSYLARHAGVVYCVDTWQAAKSTPHMAQEAQQRDILSIFRGNIFNLGLYGKVKPLVMTSIEAARIFRDGCADMVFIDCDHVYTSITQDIHAWALKVKKGGILCGHDCEILWKDCTKDQKDHIEQLKETDFIRDAVSPGVGIHPGVTLAIHEIFDDQVQILPGSSIWWVRV